MTRQEFLDFAVKNNYHNKFWGFKKELVSFKPYDRTKLENDIRQAYNGKINPEKMLDFFQNVGEGSFERNESVSGDKLKFYIRWTKYFYYWEDIKSVVNLLGYIENCAGYITDLFISENGQFYDKSHTLLAENEEQFFDYLTTVEFDFHPEIAERTYEMIRFFGWYEGRHIDTADFNKEMLKRGIELTQKQLDFLAEFSGLYFSFKDDGYDWLFYSLDEILENNPERRTGFKKTVVIGGEVVAENALVCGDAPDTPDPIYIDSEGRLLSSGLHYGRNTIESINHLANNVSRDVEWLS